jgi:hypothetical protein
MRYFRIRLQIDIDRGEKHPFPIGGHDRFRDAFQEHHVFEGERMGVLTENGKS